MSSVARQSITIGSGILLLVAGFLCLNCTKAFDVEHHVEWAKMRQMPEPSYGIFLAGVPLLAVGGVILGRLRRI